MMANYATHIRIDVWLINGRGYGKCALYNWDMHMCSEKLISWRSQEIEKMSTKHSVVWGGCWKSERLFGDLWIACDGPGQWFQDHGNMPSIHHLCSNISFSEDGCKKYCNTKILPLTKVSKGCQPNVINAYNVRLSNECIRKCILTKGHCWKGIEEDKEVKIDVFATEHFFQFVALISPWGK